MKLVLVGVVLYSGALIIGLAVHNQLSQAWTVIRS